MSAPEIHVRNSPTHCPYCKSSIVELREVVACARCGARHHASCRAEHGKCAVCSALELLVYAAGTAPLEAIAQGLTVEHEGDARVYKWRILTKEGLDLVYRDAFLRLAPHDLSFTALFNRSLFLAHGDKLEVREVAIRSGRLLVTFEGDRDVVVATESIGSPLAKEDLERLERAILEWLRG
jgi:hypothetical protein